MRLMYSISRMFHVLSTSDISERLSCPQISVHASVVKALVCVLFVSTSAAPIYLMPTVCRSRACVYFEDNWHFNTSRIAFGIFVDCSLSCKLAVRIKNYFVALPLFHVMLSLFYECNESWLRDTFQREFRLYSINHLKRRRRTCNIDVTAVETLHS